MQRLSWNRKGVHANAPQCAGAFPTHRRVVIRDEHDHSLLTAPSLFAVDLESVVVTRG